MESGGGGGQGCGKVLFITRDVAMCGEVEGKFSSHKNLDFSIKKNNHKVFKNCFERYPT